MKFIKLVLRIQKRTRLHQAVCSYYALQCFSDYRTIGLVINKSYFLFAGMPPF